MKNLLLRNYKSILTLFVLSLGLMFELNAQTSNVTTAYNLDKGAIEISFDLAGPETSRWNVNVALVQNKDSKLIEIPASNINKSLRGLAPGKHQFEISFADLQIEGDFSTKLDAYGSGSAESRRPAEASKPAVASKPKAVAEEPAEPAAEEPAEEAGTKMYTKKPKKKAAVAEKPAKKEVEEEEKEEPAVEEKEEIVTKNVESDTEETDEYIPEDNVPAGSKGTLSGSSKSKTPARIIKGFTVKGTSISDLSLKIKQASSEMMILSDLTPVNLNLDLKRLTFKCDFVANNSNISKMGLYFGPKSTGCESCINVVISNPGSTVLLKGSNGVFDYEVIGIKRN